MSWVRLLIEVNMSLSSNVVFGYQESFKKIEKVKQTIFSKSLKLKKKIVFYFSIYIKIKKLEVFNF